VMPLIGALYFWFPKVTGRMMSETLGKWSFWLTFIGFNIAFFTMHYTGFMGMPRRVHTYLGDSGFGTPMLITFIGALFLGAGVAITLVNAILSMVNGPPAGDNPWDAGTLEWATTSPPATYNFAAIPTVHSRNPLWEGKFGAAAERRDYHPLGTEGRETLGTSPFDGIVQQRLAVAGPSIWPFVMAVGTSIGFLGLLVSVLLAPVGALITFVAIVAWNWPSRRVVE
jgi:cytochrome c oxidase subunit I+III